MSVICPTCSETARASMTRFGERHDCCGLWSWGGAPLVDRETHDARTAAHDAFDPLWKHQGMTRGKAYKALAAELQMLPQNCHIKTMDAETARRVPAAVARMRP